MLSDAASDLLLGSHCVGCARPGRLLCRSCRAQLPETPFAAWPAPTPPGLARPVAAGVYGGVVRAMVVGHKERGLHALRAPLGELLAGAVAVAAGSAGGPAAGVRLVLVPVPSRAASVRARGHDPTYAVCRAAASSLRAAGLDAGVWPLLRLRPGVVDQSGLDRAERAANLAGSMACSTARLRALARRGGPVRVVVCDDVLTTGSTAREAQRALAAVGLTVASGGRRGGHPQAGPVRAVKLPTNAFRGLGGPTNVDAWSPSGSVVASSGRPRPGGKPMPVAGEAAHVSPPCGDDHGAA